MKATIAVALLLITCGSMSGQQTAPDVDGWNGSKWGMSLAQVKAAVEYPIERDAKLKDVLRITRLIEVDSIPVRVSFEFATDKLKFVTLVVDEGYNRNLAFDSLKQSLIEKYGKPSDQDVKTEHPVPGPLGSDIAAVHRTALWTFPSTAITLDWMEYGDTGSVMILYKEVNKKTPL
jgi:hypothetical protein